MNRRKLIGEFLSLLERKETSLLAWGFLDGSFSADEIMVIFREAATPLVEALDDWVGESSVELFVDNLAQANLLVRTDSGYRSRFAETVRLLGRLRQRFSSDDWASAPNLVSDLKIHLAARSYPKRDIVPKDAWEEIQEVCWSKPVQKFVFEALTNHQERQLTLAGFQVRATKRILSHYQPFGGTAGTVISAGTGSGKTKAFYLPAFMGIAADIMTERREFTKVLAIYPRNVLLADQFTEAVSQGKILHQAGRTLTRPVTFAAYLGETPYTSKLIPGQHALKNWKRTNDPKGWIPPFIKHPEDGSEIVWLDTDRDAGRSTLCSVRNPKHVVVPDGIVRLTRDQIRKHPPDVLMMSLEMLNREMSDPESSALLGFNPQLPEPRLVLLDEIHTYEGMSGAQVPWILRRWSHWVRRLRGAEVAPHFVGLSATLKEASLHLATLSGAQESSVAEIKPETSRGELESEGIEYNVALKSHAGSGASVLATSIQTVMLGARTLSPSISPGCCEPSDDLAAQHFYGKKVFGFTDNLDSLNRWFADFIDADGIRRLARYRASAGVTDVAARTCEGQIWRLCEDLQHDLTQGLRTSRCSSQDPGVSTRSDVVLATSSLEVGYDDPNVGMTVHHKSPSSAASFLQRKGRAGRQRGIRPWTLVVLSDFGRDRWAFRNSEHIFQPELDPLKIPALNPYVVRVQATQFLIDWIGLKLGQGAPYRYLSGFDCDLNEKVKSVLLNLITDKGMGRGEFLKEFFGWLKKGAIGLRLIDPVSLGTSVLWDPPRAVLRHAVPELAKVVSACFKPLGEDVSIKQQRPLPRFLPAATFGTLDAQDVEIQFDDSREPEVVDIAVALREAPPCRVSRRYAVAVRKKSLWHMSSQTVLNDAPTTLPVATLFHDSFVIGVVSGVEISQPKILRLSGVPDCVSDSSSASWEWDFHAEFVGTKERLGLVDGPILSRVFSACDGYFHRRYAHGVLTRFAERFRYEAMLSRGVKKRGTVKLVREDENCETIREAVGYRRLVDAMLFKVDAEHIAAIPQLDKMALQRLRPYYYKYRLNTSPILTAAASPFGIGALWSSSIAMMTATALLRKRSLQEAASLLRDRSAAAKKVFQCMLLGQVASSLEEGEENAESASSKRIREIEDLWQNTEVREEVLRLEPILWAPEVEGIDDWLVKIYLETLAQALEQAIWAVLPETPEGDFSIDITSSDDGYSLVLSETASGGVGHLERLALEIGNAPERFDAAFEAALKTCDNERLTCLILTSVEKAKTTTTDVSVAFEQVRAAVSFDDLDAAKDGLIDSLRAEGLAIDRTAVSAVASKVLRPGSTHVTDRWIRLLNRKRAKLSERVGIAIDPRVFAYFSMQTPGMSRRMRDHLRQIGQTDPNANQIYNAFVQLDFEGCSDSCHECLGLRKELEGIVPSRWLAKKWIDLEAIDVCIDAELSACWKEQLAQALREAHRIRLNFSDTQRVEVANVLSGLLAQEHDRGYIFSPFTTLSISHRTSHWEAVLQPSAN